MAHRKNNKQTINWPFFILPHYQVLFGELIQGLCKKLTKIKKQDWHIHMHIWIYMIVVPLIVFCT